MIEHGTLSRAAPIVNISQPAMSKLIVHLEDDIGLRLFDRLKGRLAPTEHAMRLYEEVGRIFAGVSQIQNAVDALRREGQGRISVGVMPALSGPFIQRATSSFLNGRANVFCSVQSLGSQWVVDGLVTRRLDVGLVEPGLDNPYLKFEPLMEHPLVCIMPVDHPLSVKSVIEPDDLDELPFVALASDSYIGHRLEAMFVEYKIRPDIVIVANIAPILLEFVAAGHGVSLAHPLAVIGLEHKLAVRRFEPEIPFNFQLCRNIESRNAELIEAFAQELRTTSEQMSSAMLDA